MLYRILIQRASRAPRTISSDGEKPVIVEILNFVSHSSCLATALYIQMLLSVIRKVVRWLFKGMLAL